LVAYCTSIWVALLFKRCSLVVPSYSSIPLLLRAESSEAMPFVSRVTCRWVSNADSRVLILPSCLLRWHGDVVHRLLTCRGHRCCRSQVLHLYSIVAVASHRRLGPACSPLATDGTEIPSPWVGLPTPLVGDLESRELILNGSLRSGGLPPTALSIN